MVVDARAREPAKAFMARGGQRNARGGGPTKPPERTEGAVELGLDFLARHQSADGRWSLADRGNEKEKPSFQADSAATGLALLSFLGAGYDHYDDQYQHVVQAGLQFLLKTSKPAAACIFHRIRYRTRVPSCIAMELPRSPCAKPTE